MFDEYSKAITNYQEQWETLIASRNDQTFFQAQQPTAVAWKVQDIQELEERFAALRDQCDQMHWGWINERWLITLHLKAGTLPWGIRLIKLMQRKPHSTDPVGLDHIDFYHPANAPGCLQAEPNLRWSKEMNGEKCKWVSVWFAGTEAKLRTYTVLGVCAVEMQELETSLLGA